MNRLVQWWLRRAIERRATRQRLAYLRKVDRAVTTSRSKEELLRRLRELDR